MTAPVLTFTDADLQRVRDAVTKDKGPKPHIEDILPKSPPYSATNIARFRNALGYVPPEKGDAKSRDRLVAGLRDGTLKQALNGSVVHVVPAPVEHETPVHKQIKEVRGSDESQAGSHEVGADVGFVGSGQAPKDKTTAYDKSGASPTGGKKTAKAKRPGRPSSTEELVKIAAAEEVIVFIDQDGHTWARTPDRRILEVNEAGIGAWLAAHYYAQTGTVPSKDAAKDVSRLLNFQAQQSGDIQPVYLRFGPLPDGEGVAIDMGDAERNAIIITTKSWMVGPHPINFRRTLTQGVLPVPRKTAARELPKLLKKALGLRDEDLIPLTGWLISTCNSVGPYAVLDLSGAPGSGKTMRAKLLRRILDPTHDKSGGVKSMPTSEDSFAAIVSMNMLPAFDQLTGLSREQANWLCQTATGYGTEKRQLYTDGGSYMRSALSAVILNGVITNEHGDLANRSIVVDIPPLEPTDVDPDSDAAAYATGAATVESALYREFDALHPRILGALCEAVSYALENLDAMPEGNWPRMADVCRFVSAAEPALGWEAGTFATTLVEAQRSAAITILSKQAWWGPLKTLLAHGKTFSGNHADLLEKLREIYEGRDQWGNPVRRTSSNIDWPKSERGLAAMMSQNALALREVGVIIRRSTVHGYAVLEISQTPQNVWIEGADASGEDDK